MLRALALWLLLAPALMAQTTLAAIRTQEYARCSDAAVWRALLADAGTDEVRSYALQAMGRVGHVHLRPVFSEQLAALQPTDAKCLRQGATIGTALMGDAALLAPLARCVSGAALAFAVGCVGALPAGDAGATVREALATETNAVQIEGALQDHLCARLIYGLRWADPELPQLVEAAFTAPTPAGLPAAALARERLHAALFVLQRGKTRPAKVWRARVAPLLLDADERIAGRAARVLALVDDADGGDAAVISAAFLESGRNSGFAQVERLRALAMLPLGADSCAALLRALTSEVVALERTAFESLAAGAKTLATETRSMFTRMAQAAAGASAHVEVSRAAVEALAALDPAVFLREARMWRLKRGWQVRAVAADAAAMLLPDPAASAVLRLYAQDSDARVRAALVEGGTRWLKQRSGLTRADADLLLSIADSDNAARSEGEFVVPLGADPVLLAQWARLAEVLYSEKCVAALGPPTAVTLLLQALRERIPANEVECLQAAMDLARVAGDQAALQHWAHCIEPALHTPAEPTAREAVVLTTRGRIALTLFADDAPATVANFVALARSGWFDGLMWHRRVPGFVAQAGCPRGDGWGAGARTIPCEVNARTYRRGSLGMALAGKDTGGNQWFLCLADAPHLDGRYTLFGCVRGGWEVLDSLCEDDQILGVEFPEPR